MITTAPPTIPACRKGASWDAREHLLMWVHTGRGYVRLASGHEHRVDAGTGIWLPPGPDHDMWTDPGSLAFPTWISPHAAPGAPAHVTRFTVDDGWRDWLIAHYAHAITRSHPSIGRQVSPGDLVAVLDSSRPCLLRSDGRAEQDRYPPMPRTAGARKVARELLRNPALDYTVEQWAVLAACSPNTLRRDFLGHTGMTFAQWRNLCRLTAACEFLASGYDVGQVAARAGFSTRNGFTRAFRERYRTTPRDYAAKAAAAADGRPSRRVAADRRAGALAHLLDDAPAPPHAAVPGARSTARTDRDSVLHWIYRGEGWARVGDTIYPRQRGDTIWLPARMENETGLPENSLALPVSFLGTDEARITEPLRARFPPAWDTYLLYCSVSAHTLLRPENYNPRHILGVFGDQLAVERARTVPMPKNAHAREAATDFLRRIGTSSESMTFEVSGDIHGAFLRETGMTFVQWRRAARMRLARDLLAGGAKPRVVAGRVGYTQVSNFSRAFTRFHGVPPREYQKQEREPDPA